jgi:hypothetical protein
MSEPVNEPCREVLEAVADGLRRTLAVPSCVGAVRWQLLRMHAMVRRTLQPPEKVAVDFDRSGGRA